MQQILKLEEEFYQMENSIKTQDKSVFDFSEFADSIKKAEMFLNWLAMRGYPTSTVKNPKKFSIKAKSGSHTHEVNRDSFFDLEEKLSSILAKKTKVYIERSLLPINLRLLFDFIKTQQGVKVSNLIMHNTQERYVFSDFFQYCGFYHSSEIKEYLISRRFIEPVKGTHYFKLTNKAILAFMKTNPDKNKFKSLKVHIKRAFGFLN